MTTLPTDLDPRVAFEDARSVLRGTAHEVNTPEVRKMVAIILGSRQADASIASDGFRVDFGFRQGPLSYWPELAAPTLYAICRAHLGVTSVRFRLSTDEIRRIRIGHNNADRWLWMFEEPRRILLFSREARHEIQPENPAPLDRWVSAKRVWAIFDAPVACPHCNVSAVRFRAVERALICQSCGRSWAVQEGDLERAQLETG